MWWAAIGLAGIGGMLLQEWFGEDTPENVTYNVTLLSGSAAAIIVGGLILWQMLKK